MTAIASQSPVTQGSRALVWVGRVVSALPALALLASSAAKLSQQPKMLEMFTGHLGFQPGALTAIGLLELICTVIYLIPRTAVLGAALLTAYLGGAVAIHVRVGDPFALPVVLGVLVWLGLYLRDVRLRAVAWRR
jgi:hypothetical protein